MKAMSPTMDSEPRFMRRVDFREGSLDSVYNHPGRSFFNYDETFFGRIPNSPETDLRLAMMASEKDLMMFLEHHKATRQFPGWNGMSAFDDVIHDDLMTEEKLASPLTENTMFYMDGIPPSLIEMSSSNGSMDMDMNHGDADGLDEHEINVVDVEDAHDGMGMPTNTLLLQQDGLQPKGLLGLPGTKLKRHYPCPKDGCGKIFTSNNGLRYHLDRGHRAQPQKDLRCPYPGCDKSYRSRPGLQYHIKQVHDQRASRPQSGDLMAEPMLEHVPSPMSTTFNFSG